MSLQWIQEKRASWDDGKQRIIGQAADGIFDRRYRETKAGDLLPGEWWRAEKDGKTVGYGWLDLVWGDAEILLAVDPGEQGTGVGSFILEELAREARAMGVNYIYNIVRPTHPDRDKVHRWFEQREFKPSEDGSLLRAVSKPRE